MNRPERFSNLGAYAFPRLRALLDHHAPGGTPVAMTIGEPTHAFPEWVKDVLAENMAGFGVYPANDGTPALLSSIQAYLKRRYGVEVEQENLMALNGTREGLYNVAMALVPERKNGARPAVLMPNPFYQVYMVAAKSVDAEVVFVPALAETGFLPDYTAVDPSVLDRTALVYICSPANPQGAVASAEYWRDLITLAEKHDFRIVADECYAEIWRGTAPTGALEIAKEMGADPERILSFHSLSKRSNLPGLRSGFVCGGKQSIAAMRQLRAFSGAPIPNPLQAVAARAWADDDHVVENRALYDQKFRMADQILGHVPGYVPPPAGFFLWLPVENGEAAALKLWTETGVRVLPGGYFGREVDGINPGHGYLRVALVAPTQELQRGLTLLRECLYG